MKKKRQDCFDLREIAGSRFIAIMKLSLILTFAAVLSVSANVNVMSQKVTLNYEDAELRDVFRSLTEQTGHRIVYSFDKLRSDRTRVSVRLTDVELSDALDQLLEGIPYGYTVNENTVVIFPKKEEAAEVQQPRQSTVMGQVTDEQGLPMPGVTVLLKGTTIGVTTDADGRYSLRYDTRYQTLEFSFLGYKKTEAQIDGRAQVDIQLQTDMVGIEDVLVTGYQTISRERATGAYSIINSDQLAQKPTTNIAGALNGLVPGLTVQSSPVDGQTRFMIRGRGTLQNNQADRDPLIVVDGFPINGYSAESGRDDESEKDRDPLMYVTDPFSTINPNDVESITVLKDAAATSIYGARAANGVIVITTKKGSAGKRLEISADAFYSISSKPDLDYLYNMASAESQFRYVETRHQYNPISLTGTSDPYQTLSQRRKYMSAPYSLLFGRDNKGNITQAEYDAERARLIALGNSGQWKDDLNKYIYRNSVNRQYNLSLRGSSEKIGYAFSSSYDEQDGYLKGNSSRRIVLNMSSVAHITKNLSFDLNVNTVFSKKENNGVTITNLSPWSRLVDDAGNFVHYPTADTVYEPILRSEYEGNTPASWLYNPAEDRKYTDNHSNNMNYRVHGGFDYKTTWGLKLSAKGQYERSDLKIKKSYDQESYYVRDLYNTYSTLNPSTGSYTSYFPAGGVFSDSGNLYEGYTLRGQADYTFTRGKHYLSVLAGTEIISSKTEYTPQVTRYGYNKYTNSVMTTPDYITRQNNIFGVSSLMPYDALETLSTLEDRFFSVYANAAYTFDDRLSVTASFRTDASNYQAEEVRDKFSPFWSVGSSWLLSRERFMENATWVDMLKLRASYGIAGVAAGKSGTSSVTTTEVWPGNVTYTNNNAYNTISVRGNPTLTWEKSRTFNIGMDASFWNGKLFGSFEFYNKNSYDVLSSATVPSISQGTSSATFNNAEILNRGIELSLGSDLKIAGDLRWRGVLNMDYNHNEVKKYLVTSSFYPANSNVLMERYPIDFIAVLNAAGYTSEGYMVLQGKDGSTDVVKDYDTSHTLDAIDRPNGENIEDSNWWSYLGTSTPKTNLSFSNQFTYRGWTLSFMITGRFGYYARQNNSVSTDTNLSSYSKELENAFRVLDEGYANQSKYTAFPMYNDDNADVFKSGGYLYTATTAGYLSNNFIKGDHIRLNEVYLGYDLPRRWLSKQNVFSRINIYGRASNLGIIWSANKKMDPDYPITTIKPLPTFLFGVKLNFK